MAIIYLADRDDAFRRALAHGLRQCGHEIVDFESGSELYARAVTGEPDLIALETDLEDMDGFRCRSRAKRAREAFTVISSDFPHPRVARVLKKRGVGVVERYTLEKVLGRSRDRHRARSPLQSKPPRRWPAPVRGDGDARSRQRNKALLVTPRQVLEAK